MQEDVSDTHTHRRHTHTRHTHAHTYTPTHRHTEHANAHREHAHLTKKDGGRDINHSPDWHTMNVDNTGLMNE